MGYRETRPVGRWAGVVEAAWAAGVPAGGPAVVEAVLPDGCMDIMWTGRELMVAGPDTEPHPYRREPGLLTCGLRFAPGQLPERLAVPAAELRNQRVPLADLHPGLARAATGRIADAPDVPGVLAELIDLAGALPQDHADPAVAVLVARLASADPADTAVATVADSFGWTTRTLHRRCVAAFGYGPAVLRRILRFRRATNLLTAGVRPAEVAAVAGYADQPHLSRELRALGNLAPAQVARGANRSTPFPSGSRTVA